MGFSDKLLDAKAKAGTAVSAAQQLKSKMEKDLEDDQVTLDKPLADQAAQSCDIARQKLYNSLANASQLFDQTPISRSQPVLVDAFCNRVGGIKNELEKAFDLMSKAQSDCVTASGIISEGLNFHAVDPLDKQPTRNSPKVPPQILSSQGLPSRKYGEYTMRRDKASTDNSYTCNALHYHLLQIIENRTALGARLSEAYFIHLPYAKKSKGWDKTVKDEPKYEQLKAQPKDEAAGYTLLAKAVAELIKAIVG